MDQPVVYRKIRMCKNFPDVRQLTDRMKGFEDKDIIIEVCVSEPDRPAEYQQSQKNDRSVRSPRGEPARRGGFRNRARLIDPWKSFVF
jgi:hypothetical protein